MAKDNPIKGDNFTREYKYPIKVYKIWKIESSNGWELRKLIVAGITALFVISLFIGVGYGASDNVVSFILTNWLIILVGIPSIVTFLVFSLKYDDKPVIPFIKDRFRYYKKRHKAYEHFEEVPMKQFETELVFEEYKRKGEG